MKHAHKQIAIIILTILSVIISTPVSYAQGAVVPTTDAQRYIDRMRVTEIRDRGVFEADGRISYLSMLLARVNQMDRIQAAQKARLSGTLTDLLTELKAIKTKLQKDSQVSEVVRERQLIAKSYNTYLFLRPQVRIMYFAENAIDLANEMKANVTDQSAQALLNDAIQRSERVLADVAKLTPEGYPANREELLKARQNVRLILTDLKDARRSVR